MVTSALDGSSNFSSEVLVALLQALALGEVGEGSDLDVTAQSLRGVGNVLLDVHAAVLDEGLVDQAGFLVELAQLADGHLLLDSVGLVGSLGIVGHLSQNDLLLLGQDVLGHVGLVQVAGVSSSDLHGDVLAEGSELGLGSDVVRGLELDDDAVGAAAMDVGSAVALIAGKAANLDVLLDDEDQSLQGIVNRAVAHLAGHQGLNIGGVLVSNDLGQVLGEVNKLVVLGDEVGLGVDLNDNSAVVERNGDPLELNRSLQELAEERGLRFMRDEIVRECEEGPARKKTPATMQKTYIRRAEKEIASEGGYSWVSDIRSRVTVAKALARNEDEFMAVLATLEVDISQNSEKSWRRDWIYSLADHPTWRIGGEKLGLSFGQEALRRRFGRIAAWRPTPAASREVLSHAAEAIGLNDLAELGRLSAAIETCMAVNAHSIADLDRRIARLESHGEGDSRERASSLREVREYVAQNRLLPKTVQTRRPKEEKSGETPVKRKGEERRSRETPARQTWQRDRREER